MFVDHDPSRLAGVPDATYTVHEGTLNHRTEKATSPTGPHAVVEVQGPPGGRLPELPLASVEEITPGAYRLAVPASHSDIVLRTLLTTRPSWHVMSVTRADTPPDQFLDQSPDQEGQA